MERFVDSQLKTEIKQLINMQSLLDQYDRQNKFLNKQVLQLLEENKVLKIDKIKQNIITQLADVNKYKKKSKMTKQDDLNIFKKLKEKNEVVQVNSKIILKKDQSVQATSDEPTVAEIKLNKIQMKKRASDAFSFGSRTGRDSPETKKVDQSKQQSPAKEIQTIANSPEKFQSTDFKQTYKTEFLRSPIEHFQDNDRLKMQHSREQNRFGGLVREDNFSRQSLGINKWKKQSRSSHAIEPSRKIEPSKSSKSLFMQQGNKYVQRASSYSCFKSQSIEKKKKFIDVVSSKEKKASWQQKGWGCC